MFEWFEADVRESVVVAEKGAVKRWGREGR
jgi:hypothetical protein